MVSIAQLVRASDCESECCGFKDEGQGTVMNKNNVKKSEQLGMPFGTACGRLRKMVLFDLVQKLKLDKCFQCGVKIVDIENFSIEHKVVWLNNDSNLFWDLDNIAFSHRSCNSSAARKSTIKAKGEATGLAKLTDGDISIIRNSEKSLHKLARNFGVSRNTIRDVVRGNTWKHV